MDVREKLVELIGSTEYGNGSLVGNKFQKGFIEKIATHLITNGVTVHEWISVDDMLPEPFVSVLVQMPGEEPFPTVREGFISNDGIWQSEMFRREPGEVTHWMPMLNPSKGE